MAKMMKLRVQRKGSVIEISQIGQGQRNIPYRLKTVTVTPEAFRAILDGTAFWEGSGIVRRSKP